MAKFTNDKGEEFNAEAALIAVTLGCLIILFKWAAFSLAAFWGWNALPALVGITLATPMSIPVAILIGAVLTFLWK